MNGEEGVHSLCSSRGLASQLLLSISPSTKNVTGTSTYASTSSSTPPPPNTSTTNSTTTPTSTAATTVNSTADTATTSSTITNVHNSVGTATATTTASATVNKKDNSNDPVLEWLHILFFYLLQTSSNRLLQLFKTLQPRAVGESVWDFKTDSSSDNNLFFEEKLNEMELNDRAVLTHEQVS